MSDEKTASEIKYGRKFMVVKIVTIEMTLGMFAGIVGAYMGVDLPWLSVVLPILAAVYPAYLGANAYQKGKQGGQG